MSQIKSKKDNRITTYVPEDTYAKLLLLALQRNTSLSRLVCEFLEKGVERTQEEMREEILTYEA